MPASAYRHSYTGEDNADAHLERQIMGREVVVAITKGKLDFGPWEHFLRRIRRSRAQASPRQDNWSLTVLRFETRSLPANWSD